MTLRGFSESIVEDVVLEWLEAQSYAVLHGPQIALGPPTPAAKS
jgi:hypothetical protein